MNGRSAVVANARRSFGDGHRRTNPSVGSWSGRCTAAALSAAAILHVVWATGSTFPFRTRAALNDTVIGRRVAPGPLECVAVAGLLVAAAGVVTSADRRHRPLSRSASFVVALVFAIRAAFGFGGRTSMLVPGSESPRFKRMDRRVYAPVCTALAVGAAAAARG